VVGFTVGRSSELSFTLPGDSGLPTPADHTSQSPVINAYVINGLVSVRL
jgi:hypothetical protein